MNIFEKIRKDKERRMELDKKRTELLIQSIQNKEKTIKQNKQLKN